MKILLIVSGGIAAYKAPRIISLLVEKGHTVQVVVTAHALQFVSRLVLATLSGHPVRMELFDQQGDWEMEHIRLPEWADLVLVAPASANLLGKVANGIADDLASTLLSAVGTREHAACPVVYAPAMNHRMWNHAATQENVNKLIAWGATVIPPEVGRLACSDHAVGRMPEPDSIITFLEQQGLIT